MKDNSEHTPGPWRVATNAIIGKYEGKTTRICTMTVRRSASLIPKEEQMVNANLIASAPDLVKEVEHLKSIIAEQAKEIEELKATIKDLIPLAERESAHFNYNRISRNANKITIDRSKALIQQ